ncbi:MAG: hypothetical protein CMJ94_01960 [Planctomycetes bacterium]|nr:hypothetical protein [Planctomycetota bacterium]
MGFAAIALLPFLLGPGASDSPEASLQPAPRYAQDLTDEEAVEVFVKLAKDKKAVPDLLVFGIDDLQKRYAASADRALRAFDKLESGEGKASDWKKLIKAEVDTQEELAKGVWAAFRYRKEVNDQHMQVWRRGITAFGNMGEHGSEYLWEIFEDKRFSRDGGFRGRCVEEIGRTRDYEQYEALLDLLDHHLEEVVVGVGKAFLHYDKAPGKIRRECTEKLVRAVESYRSRGQGGENINGPRIWGKVKGPLMAALKSLTGKSYSTSLDWTKFWNEYKNDKAMWSDD